MSTLNALRLALALLACLAGFGCSGAGAGSVRVSVVDDRGEPLAEVAIRSHTKLLARSDSRGHARIALHSVPAGAAVEAHCPEAYRPASPQRLGPDVQRLGRLMFVCRPRLRTLAVVTYAPSQPGALVRSDEQALGRVAKDGTLHAVVRRAPGETFVLRVDALPKCALPVRVPDRDELILFDTTRQ